MNPWIKKALSWAPTLSKLEKFGRYALIIGILLFVLYCSREEMSRLDRNMSKRGSSATDAEWEDETQSSHWVLDMISRVFSDNFSWFAIKEMSFYIFLTIFSLGGFAILSHYNHKHDQRLLELEQEELRKREEQLEKEKKASSFKPKVNKKND